MRRKDVEDCEYLTIYLFINKLHCGLKICQREEWRLDDHILAYFL